jgi:adenosylcobinamide amidohydrolase/ABC-type Fe3+-hydroxamate transport system substrate-binding protein
MIIKNLNLFFRYKRRWALLTFFLIRFLVLPCQAMEIRDSQNRPLQLDVHPERIVSLVPSASEILVKIGAGDCLVGTTYHDITLAGSEKRQVAGGFFNPFSARIKGVNPDLIIAAPLHKEVIESFTAQGIPVFIYKTMGLDHTWNLMAKLGKITGKNNAALDLIQKNKRELAHIRAKLNKAGVTAKRVIRLMGRDQIMTPGSDSFQNEMIRAAGGLAPDFGKAGDVVPVTLEEWRAFDPQVIYGCGGDRAAADSFFLKPGWKDVAAVKDQRIHYFPCDLTCRASARTSAFVAGLASNIYAEEFSESKNFVFQDGQISQAPLVKDITEDLPYVGRTAVVKTHLFDFENKSLMIDLDQPMAVLSTLEGFKTGVRTLVNHYLPPPTWMPSHFKGVDHLELAVFKALNRKADQTALLMTGADMDHLSVQTRKFKEMSVTALVTAGVVSNAMRMAEDIGEWYEPGTINIIVLSNMKLSRRAMARAVITATEAKTAALEDLDIRSAYTGKIYSATGTGTDNLIVVQGRGNVIDNSGGHTKMGELIAKAVHAGVKDAIARQNGLLPGRHLIQRLKERKISLYQLTSEAQCRCQGEKSDFSAMVEALMLNPEYEGFMEAALSLSDAYERDLVQDLSAFDRWCARVARDICGSDVKIELLVQDEKIPLVISKALNAVMTGAWHLVADKE